MNLTDKAKEIIIRYSCGFISKDNLLEYYNLKIINLEEYNYILNNIIVLGCFSIFKVNEDPLERIIKQSKEYLDIIAEQEVEEDV